MVEHCAKIAIEQLTLLETERINITFNFITMALQITYTDRYGVTHDEAYLKIISANVEKGKIVTTPMVNAVYTTVITPAVEATYDEEGNELTPFIDQIEEQVLVSEEQAAIIEDKLLLKSTAAIFHSVDTKSFESLAVVSITPTIYKDGNVFEEAYAKFKSMNEGALDV